VKVRELLGSLAVPGYHVGDCRWLMRQLPADSINCVVTSPPYWALRDYKIDRSVWGGSSDCYHVWGDTMRLHKGGPHGAVVLLDGGRAVVDAQADVKDIDAGAFCQACGGWVGQLGLEPTPDLFLEHMVEVFEEVRRVLTPDGTCWVNMGDSYMMRQPNRLAVPGLKPKDKCMIPARLAIALQASGWWLRDEIVWHKPNPMPESIADRTTKSHEFVYLLTKSASYFYDAEAIKEPTTGEAHARGKVGAPKASGPTTLAGRGTAERGKRNASFNAACTELVSKRNRRSVWSIPTEPTADAHFATFPTKLVEPCILAGCPPGGVVLDPFGGSGTVGRVAEDLGRRWLLFDLNPEYEKIAKRRTAQVGLLGRLPR